MADWYITSLSPLNRVAYGFSLSPPIQVPNKPSDFAAIIFSQKKFYLFTKITLKVNEKIPNYFEL